MGFFSWLRHRVRTAILSGFSDAIEELTANDVDGEQEAVALLRVRLEALPAPEGEQVAAKKRGNKP